MVLRAKGQEMLKKKKKKLFRLEEIKKRIPNKNIILKKKKNFAQHSVLPLQLLQSHLNKIQMSTRPIFMVSK